MPPTRAPYRLDPTVVHPGRIPAVVWALESLGPEHPFTVTAFTPDGRYVLLARQGKTEVAVLELATGKWVSSFVAHSAPPLGVAVRPDGMAVSQAAGADHAIVWDPATGRERGKIASVPLSAPKPDGHGHIECGSPLSISPDGRLLLVSRHGSRITGRAEDAPAADGEFAVVDMAEGRVILQRKWTAGVMSFTSDSRQLRMFEHHGLVTKYDLSSGRMTERVAVNRDGGSSGNVSSMPGPLDRAIWFGPIDATQVHAERVIDLSNGKVVGTIPVQGNDHGEIHLSADGGKIGFTAVNRQKKVVWFGLLDGRTFENQVAVPMPYYDVNAGRLRLSPDGTFALVFRPESSRIDAVQLGLRGEARAGPSTAPADKAPPASKWFEGDRKRLDDFRTARATAFRETAGGAFDRLVPPTARGRAAGLAALDAAAPYLSQRHRSDIEAAELDALFQKAIAEGCTDPLVRYFAARFANWSGRVPFSPDLIAEAAALADSKYPAVRRMLALHNAALASVDPGPEAPEVRERLSSKLIADYWNAVRSCATGSDYDRDELLECARLLLRGESAFGMPRSELHRKFLDVLDSAKAPAYMKATVDGLYHYYTAVSMVEFGPESQLTEPERRRFREAAQAANDCFERAWRLRPRGECVPNHAIGLAGMLHLGAEERDRWFRRALVENPINEEACMQRLRMLEPRWGGSVAEMLEFCRECRRAGFYAEGISTLPITACQRISSTYRPGFLSSPEGWTEVEPVFREWLTERPKSLQARTLYAKVALAASRYGTALEQFERLGDAPWRGVYPYPAEYRRDVSVARVRSRLGDRPDALPGDGYLLPSYPTGPAVAKARGEWYAKLSGATYAKLNRVGSKGYKEGLAALAAAASQFGTGYPNNPKADAAWRAADAAVVAGCEDALVQYLHVKLGQQTGLRPEHADPDGEAAFALADSSYPPVLRLEALLALWRDTRVVVTHGAAPRGRKLPTRFWECLTAAAADSDRFAQSEILRVLEEMVALGDSLGSTRTELYERASACLKDAGSDPYMLHVLTGGERVSAAWDARGDGLADTVKLAHYSTFKRRLAEAERFLHAAWRIHPDRPEAPAIMVTVCMGLAAPRGVMEEWLDRALKADPGCTDAVRRRALYLEPKWYGQADGGRSYRMTGAEAAAKRDWDSGFGKVALDVSTTSAFAYPKWVREGEWWNEVEKLFDSWLADAPDSRYAKTLYAREAIRANKFRVADRLMRDLGDRPWPGVFPDLETYSQLAKEVRKAVAEGPR